MAETSSVAKKKVTFYVDGFNFYYGLKDISALDNAWKKYYWIDITLLCENFLKPNEELLEVHYFTARPKNNGKMTRQNHLMAANKRLHKSKFKIHYGKYQDKEIKCNAKCREKFITYEEKETDVNIAVKMIEDCVIGESDKIVLISADSDLMPPIRFIHDYCTKNPEHKKDVMILFPPQHFSSALNNCKFTAIQMGKYEGRFKKALLPKEFKTVEGSIFKIPANWDIDYDQALSDAITKARFTV